MNLTHEEFEALKQALRENGYLPNKRLMKDLFAQTNLEFDKLRITNVDIEKPDTVKRHYLSKVRNDSLSGIRKLADIVENFVSNPLGIYGVE